MNSMDKQTLKALVYIKENPNCSIDDSDHINDKIVHFLYQSHLVDATDSKTIHMQEYEYGYCYINITHEGQIKIDEINEDNSPLRVFSNKTIRFIIATIFTGIVGVASGILVFNHQKSHEQSTQQQKQTVQLEEKSNIQE